MDNKLEDLKKLTFAELKEILESVEKAIKAERIYLGEVKDAFIQDEDLWVIHNLQLTKVKDLVDKKSKRLMFNSNQLIRVKKGIDDLIIWNRRRNNIISEIKRREWGGEYFDRGTTNLSENKVEVTEEVTKVVETKNDSENEQFKKMFDELVEHHFKTDILIWQLEKTGQDKDDEYIAYCVKRFKRRTTIEWMKYYERLDKASQYKTLDDSNLPPEDDYRNRMRINNAKFEVSTLGQFTLENLELFESKYIHNKATDTLKSKIKKYSELITDTAREILTLKKESNKIEKRIEELESKFDSDIDEFPERLKEEIYSTKEDLREKNENISKLELKIWGTASEEGLIRKHDRLENQFKMQNLDDEGLFKELDNKSTMRYLEELKKKISNILFQNGIEITDNKLDDLALEILEQHHTDDTEIFEEILNPELIEVNLLKAINEVLKNKYGNIIIGRKQEELNKNENNFSKDEELELFDFDFLEILQRAEKLENKKAIQYLRSVHEKAKVYQGFEDNLDKLTFEDGLRKSIKNIEYNVDIHQDINYATFKVYDYDLQLIINFANQIKIIGDRIKYYKYVLREGNIELNHLKSFLRHNGDGLEASYSDYSDWLHRCALLYSTYKEKATGENFEVTMDAYYADELKRLEIKILRIKEELDFNLKLIDADKLDEYISTTEKQEITNDEDGNTRKTDTIENMNITITEIVKKEVPTKGLKELGKIFCQKLINNKVIVSKLEETKANKAITDLVIPEIEKEYQLTLPNKKSLHDYFRQGHLIIRYDKKLGLIVVDTYTKKQRQ